MKTDIKKHIRILFNDYLNDSSAVAEDNLINKLTEFCSSLTTHKKETKTESDVFIEIHNEFKEYLDVKNYFGDNYEFKLGQVCLFGNEWTDNPKDWVKATYIEYIGGNTPYVAGGHTWKFIRPFGDLTNNNEITEALNVLWSIKDNDKFYFDSYGSELLENLIRKQDEELVKPLSDEGIEKIGLLPCAFCGGEADFEMGHDHSYIGGYETTIYIKCNNCSIGKDTWFGHSGKDERTKEQAEDFLRKEWNTRVSSTVDNTVSETPIEIDRRLPIEYQQANEITILKNQVRDLQNNRERLKEINTDLTSQLSLYKGQEEKKKAFTKSLIAMFENIKDGYENYGGKFEVNQDSLNSINGILNTLKQE